MAPVVIWQDIQLLAEIQTGEKKILHLENFQRILFDSSTAEMKFFTKFMDQILFKKIKFYL